MIELCLTARDIDSTNLATLAERLSPHFSSVTIDASQILEIQRKPEIAPLEMRIVPEQLPSPYTVDSEEGVTVSTWQTEGICSYAGISLDTYILLCGLLGIAQWRALQSNPLLQMEDLIHPTASNCLFTMPGAIHDYVLLLEDPCVCGGCIDFYHCLGVDRELVALTDTLRTMRDSRQMAYPS